MNWSIIIPCATDSVGLEKTLLSILSQIPENLCCEIIAVNDGCNDELTRVISGFASAVKEVRLARNRGSYAARNAGIQASSGEFLAFVDAGCWLRPDWFATIDKAIADADYVAGSVQTDATLCNNLGEMYSCLMEFNSESFFATKRFGATANLLVRRSLIDRVGGFDACLRAGGDFEFGDRLTAHSDVKCRFDRNLVVFHQPRSLGDMIVKERRIIGGNIMLRARYGQRFNGRVSGASDFWPVRTLTKAWKVISPPALRGYAQPLNRFGGFRAVQLYFLIWVMKVYNCYLRRALSLERGRVLREGLADGGGSP